MDLRVRLKDLIQIQEQPAILLNREVAFLTLLKWTISFKFHFIFFTKNSSDVLQDMRVNVFEEGSENVIWYKVRNF